jgi:hypothetical protein
MWPVEQSQGELLQLLLLLPGLRLLLSREQG